MKNFGKIVGINVGILLLYSLVIRLLSGGGSHSDGSMGILIMSAYVVGAHVVVCGLVSLFLFGGSDREKARAWLATTGIVLLVGFSVCLGNAAL